MKIKLSSTSPPASSASPNYQRGFGRWWHREHRRGYWALGIDRLLWRGGVAASRYALKIAQNRLSAYLH